jgi:hypothetical protein
VGWLALLQKPKPTQARANYIRLALPRYESVSSAAPKHHRLFCSRRFSLAGPCLSRLFSGVWPRCIILPSRTRFHGSPMARAPQRRDDSSPRELEEAGKVAGASTCARARTHCAALSLPVYSTAGSGSAVLSYRESPMALALAREKIW